MISHSSKWNVILFELELIHFFPICFTLKEYIYFQDVIVGNMNVSFKDIHILQHTPKL